jgi:hypothetical protein
VLSEEEAHEVERLEQVHAELQRGKTERKNNGEGFERETG